MSRCGQNGLFLFAPYYAFSILLKRLFEANMEVDFRDGKIVTSNDTLTWYNEDDDGRG